MNAKIAESQFLATLRKLESRLEVPIVPGELAGWPTIASKSSLEVSEQFRSLIDKHNDSFEAILEHDLELASRVAEMRKRDQDLMQKTRQCASRLSDLANKSIELKNESELEAETDEMTRVALGIIIELRKQESAITTWYMEAFNRDRGVGD